MSFVLTIIQLKSITLCKCNSHHSGENRLELVGAIGSFASKWNDRTHTETEAKTSRAGPGSVTNKGENRHTTTVMLELPFTEIMLIKYVFSVLTDQFTDTKLTLLVESLKPHSPLSYHHLFFILSRVPCSFSFNTARFTGTLQ